MKRVFFSLLIFSFTPPVWAFGHTYEVRGTCQDGLSVTFTSGENAVVTSEQNSVIETCVDQGVPSYPGDDGCRKYAHIGDWVEYKLKLGSYVFKKNDLILAEYPFEIWVQSEKLYGQIWNQTFSVKNGFLSYGIVGQSLWVSYENENLSDRHFSSLIPKTSLVFNGTFDQLNRSFLNSLFNKIFEKNELKIWSCGGTVSAFKR